MKNWDRYDYIYACLIGALFICLCVIVVSGVAQLLGTIEHNANKVRYEVDCIAQGGYVAIQSRDGQPWLQCRSEKDNSIIDIQAK